MSSEAEHEDSVDSDAPPAELSPYTIRGILLDTTWTRCRYTSICYPSHMGKLAGQVRAPYLPIACELSPDGDRYLPDKTLDEVVPDWRNYMTGRTPLPPAYRHLQSAWDSWCKNERRRYFELGVPYPAPVSAHRWINFGSKRPPAMDSGWFADEDEHQFELRVNAEATVSVAGSLLDSGRAPSIREIRGMERCNEWNLPQEKIRVKHPATWLPDGAAIEFYSDGLFDIPGTRWDTAGLPRVQESDWQLLSHAEH